jgi:hypothetical protein
VGSETKVTPKAGFGAPKAPPDPKAGAAAAVPPKGELGLAPKPPLPNAVAAACCGGAPVPPLTPAWLHAPMKQSHSSTADRATQDTYQWRLRAV